MSVSGLYDSTVGDALARKTLAPYRKIDVSDIDDDSAHYAPTRRMCACGRFMIASPYVIRGGVFVCSQCAKEIRPKHGGRAVTNVCAKCGQTTPRRLLILRDGKLVCKSCEK